MVEGYYWGVYLCKYEVLGAICIVGLINSGLFGKAVVYVKSVYHTELPAMNLTF